MSEHPSGNEEKYIIRLSRLLSAAVGVCCTYWVVTRPLPMDGSVSKESRYIEGAVGFLMASLVSGVCIFIALQGLCFCFKLLRGNPSACSTWRKVCQKLFENSWMIPCLSYYGYWAVKLPAYESLRILIPSGIGENLKEGATAVTLTLVGLFLQKLVAGLLPAGLKSYLVKDKSEARK